VLEAVLWDVDGTLAETERDGHLVAMNAAFDEIRVPWRWSAERYGELLRVAGGYERLLHFMETEPLAPASMDERRALAQRIHVLKNRLYAGHVASGALPLRAGVRELFDDCASAGLQMAIVTTTSRGNVAALLGAQLGPRWRDRFAAVVCAEDAPQKKPDPQAYRIALEQLRLPGCATVAIEDSRMGLAAASAVGIPVLVTRSIYFAHDSVIEALAVGPGLGTVAGWTPAADDDPAAERVGLAQIRRWHASRG
jgi:HAD superfamily hydrolase (TIGR01509 family)